MIPTFVDTILRQASGRYCALRHPNGTHPHAIIPALVVVCLLPLGVFGATVYVSLTGDDALALRSDVADTARSGSFRTLEAARDKLRKQRVQKSLPPGPVTVEIRGGTYVFDKTFELSAEDGGSADAPVIWRAAQGERVRLVGGRELIRWFRVDDEAIRTRIPAGVRDSIRQADLRAHGVSDLGTMRSRGFGRALAPAPLELFFAGRPMTLARWPGAGEWAAISAVPDGQKGATFTCDQAPMERWKTADDLWVHGFWTYDWADTYEKIAALDPASHRFTTAPPHGVYGYTAGKRFYALNLVEELDEPGEYWVDRKGGKIYFFPPDNLEKRETWVSVLEEPLIRLRNASHVTIEGLTLEYTRGNAIDIIGGSHNLITGCTLRNIGSLAVNIAADPAQPSRGPTATGVQNCEIHDCGEGAINIEGGDRKTLTPGGNFAIDNHIYRYQRSCLTYRLAVHVHGVSQRVAHNHIHDAPHTAILIHGNDHVIEYNDIHHVCAESGDAGAFYIGRDLTERGHVVRHNYFHDIHGVKGQKGFTDVMGVYLDDCACGITVYGNIFRNVSRAVLIGGGRDNTVENNIFADCHIAIHVDARATGWAKFWWDGRDNTLIDRLKAMNVTQPPYSERYPQLVKILDDEPALPKGNRIMRNICQGPGKWLDLHDKVTEAMLGLDDNFVGTDAGLISPKPPFALRPDAPALSAAFKPIPFDQIGPTTPRRRE